MPDTPTVTKMTTCPKCQSTKIMHDVPVLDRGDHNIAGSLTVQVCEKPGALLFKGSHLGTLLAAICGECGYSELYVTNPDELYAAYTKFKQAD